MSRTCPCCGQEGPKKIPFAQAQIWVCPRCKVQWRTYDAGFVDDPVTGDEFYLSPQSIPDPASYPPFQDFFAFLARRFGEKKLRILDVGAGNGVFLRACLAQGHEAWGIEPYEENRRFMSEEVAARVTFAPLEEVRDLGHSFEVITFWDSLMYFPDPFAELERLRPWLAESGILHLRTNNNDDLYNKIAGLAVGAGLPGGKDFFWGCFGRNMFWNFSVPGLLALVQAHQWQLLHHQKEDTPADRLTQSLGLKLAILGVYGVNRLLGTGKVATYYLCPQGLPPLAR